MSAGQRQAYSASYESGHIDIRLAKNRPNAHVVTRRGSEAALVSRHQCHVRIHKRHQSLEYGYCSRAQSRLDRPRIGIVPPSSIGLLQAEPPPAPLPAAVSPLDASLA